MAVTSQVTVEPGMTEPAKSNVAPVSPVDQVYVYDKLSTFSSTSKSSAVAEQVNVESLLKLSDEVTLTTKLDGIVLPMVMLEDVIGVPSVTPSFGVTSTETSSPFTNNEPSKVIDEPFCTEEPFTNHS